MPDNSINPIGDPFAKTMLMMGIEKRDVEISQLRSMIEVQAEAIKEMSSIMQIHSQTFLSGMMVSEDDWQEFMRILNKYAIDIIAEPFTASIAGGIRNSVQEFLRYKLGTACAEKING